MGALGWTKTAASILLAAVALGAFGAHALRGRLAPELLEIYRTAVLYQMIHALAILAVAWLTTQTRDRRVAWAGGCFAAGILLFSGSLYLLCLTGVRAWGAVTPLGGLSFLAGWGLILTVRHDL